VKHENRLRELRLSKGWNQQRIADRIGVSQVMCSKYENGLVPLPGHLISALARIFEVTPKELFVEITPAEKTSARETALV